jgi:glycosyltransferase involved in cell wall biosynthesis
MLDVKRNIFIIVPCYNEADRLIKTIPEFLNSPFRFVFVNDGSTDGTKQFLEKNITHRDYVLTLEKNSGKAEAVRSGMLFLKTLNEYSDIEWAGFWDADMSTPVSEAQDFISYANEHGDADAVYGSRVLKLGSTIKRLLSRHLLGRVYCTITSICLKLDCYDSQCGAKLFRKSTLDKAFSEPFISRWIFDLEIIKRLSGFKQIEYPVTRWEDVKGSKISPFTSFPSVAVDIWKIYKKYRADASNNI